MGWFVQILERGWQTRASRVLCAQNPTSQVLGKPSLLFGHLKFMLAFDSSSFTKHTAQVVVRSLIFFSFLKLYMNFIFLNQN